ncbi:NUDIX domain-containing protein [Streptomyces sp. NPDC102473]|uniref:NUDIX domain-containing protein n=1 Tax=Streptomyces sp. NPDC102473 TaxID=3366180 RepID=UPI00381CAC64
MERPRRVPAPPARLLPGRIWEPGSWSQSGGGRVRQDATLEHTVRRERAEEAGLALADLSPFGTEHASDAAGVTVSIAIHAVCWNGETRELHPMEGAMSAWFAPMPSTVSRIADTTSGLVRHHAASRPARAAPGNGLSPQEERGPASPHGTVLDVVGVHLCLERPDGTVLLGPRHPDSVFAPSTWHALAVHRARHLSDSRRSDRTRTGAGLGAAVQPSSKPTRSCSLSRYGRRLFCDPLRASEAGRRHYADGAPVLRSSCGLAQAVFCRRASDSRQP